MELLKTSNDKHGGSQLSTLSVFYIISNLLFFYIDLLARKYLCDKEFNHYVRPSMQKRVVKK